MRKTELQLQYCLPCLLSSEITKQAVVIYLIYYCILDGNERQRNSSVLWRFELAGTLFWYMYLSCVLLKFRSPVATVRHGETIRSAMHNFETYPVSC